MPLSARLLALGTIASMQDYPPIRERLARYGAAAVGAGSALLGVLGLLLGVAGMLLGILLMMVGMLLGPLLHPFFILCGRAGTLTQTENGQLSIHIDRAAFARRR